MKLANFDFRIWLFLLPLLTAETVFPSTTAFAQNTASSKKQIAVFVHYLDPDSENSPEEENVLFDHLVRRATKKMNDVQVIKISSGSSEEITELLEDSLPQNRKISLLWIKGKSSGLEGEQFWLVAGEGQREVIRFGKSRSKKRAGVVFAPLKNRIARDGLVVLDGSKSLSGDSVEEERRAEEIRNVVDSKNGYIFGFETITQFSVLERAYGIPPWSKGANGLTLFLQSTAVIGVAALATQEYLLGGIISLISSLPLIMHLTIGKRLQPDQGRLVRVKNGVVTPGFVEQLRKEFVRKLKKLGPVDTCRSLFTIGQN